MAISKKVLTESTLEKDYRKWLKTNPKAINDNRQVLKEIANFLDKKIREGEHFYEDLAISPSDCRTNQIVIRASHETIQIIDKFLLEKGIVASKEYTYLRIDC